ncbi:hypothetical protein CRE_28774 [Caenorhabditis remanei]|uniref:polynucleotide adenylyltransferase n=1 Tax=Caenorhabditis remanei TaxID=31234 RepID=E3MJZ3_CAERE|nr:hypothetical protein CRE_28774 [Caenorhabditis remanei]
MSCAPSTKIYGVSQPISTNAPTKSDFKLTDSLNESLHQFECYESKEESMTRIKVLSKLNALVKQWIKTLTAQRIPNGHELNAGGKLISFGSYRLGVHNSGADIDALVIAPRHVARLDFFTSFKKMLLENSSVKNLACVENAFVPIMTLMSTLNNLVWDPRINYSDRFHLMPIITPAFPEQNSTHNVSKSTLHIIQEEMKSALLICDQIHAGSATWNNLFEEVNFFSRYRHFVALSMNEESNEGFFESRIRQLVQIMERNCQVKLAHINPKKFKSVQNASVWFLGLELIENVKNLDLTAEIEGFKKNVEKQANGIQITLDATYVKRSGLIKWIPVADLKKGRFVNKCTGTTSKKRPFSSSPISSEISQVAAKKPCIDINVRLIKMKSNN